MRKQLTEEQKARAEERKAQFRDLWKRVSAMPELERVQLSNRLGLVTCEGRALSLTNQMLIALQRPGQRSLAVSGSGSNRGARCARVSTGR